jgi:hypothetical protein
MKTAGLILLILGAIGTLIFGIQAMQDSKSFNLLGVDVAVSKANWTPVIMSIVALMAGLILFLRGKK